MDTTTIVMTVTSGLLGGGLIAFVQFLIQRHDKKTDKLGGITKAIEELSNKMDALDAKGDERNAVAMRVRILRFSDEMMDNRRHSKDAWDQCLSDIDEYESYCGTHPDFKNNQTAATVNYIKAGYAERLEKHDFL